MQAADTRNTRHILQNFPRIAGEPGTSIEETK